MTWKKELEHNIRDIGRLSEQLGLDRLQTEALRELCREYPMSVTRYYLSLINWENPDDPIRRMCIPGLLELDRSGRLDTSDEASNTKCEGLQHKYRETALILTTNQCAMYCRHCFRRRLVGLSEEEIARHFDRIADYVNEHKELTNVLLSGGDALMMSQEMIARYLETFSSMEHLDLIRMGSRIPVTFPMRITEAPELLTLFRDICRKKQIYLVTQFNHPHEVTGESLAAVEALRTCGLVVKNQTVLLRGVNDSPETLGLLLRKLTAAGVVPYYIFQCRPVSGVKNRFQVPLETGYDIVEKAKAQQNGLGKCFRFCMSHPLGKIEIAGKMPDGSLLFKFHQTKYPENEGRMFLRKLPPGTAWLPEDLVGDTVELME